MGAFDSTCNLKTGILYILLLFSYLKYMGLAACGCVRVGLIRLVIMGSITAEDFQRHQYLSLRYNNCESAYL